MVGASAPGVLARCDKPKLATPIILNIPERSPKLLKTLSRSRQAHAKTDRCTKHLAVLVEQSSRGRSTGIRLALESAVDISTRYMELQLCCGRSWRPQPSP